MKSPWKILIADDAEDIHTITQLTLKDIQFQGAPLKFYSAFTAEETLKVLKQEPDMAVLILDVIMETPQAGLDIIQTIRQEMGLFDLRILLRTGQPDSLVEDQVMENYDINDFLDKNEMTVTKLRSALHTAIRGFMSFRETRRTSLLFEKLSTIPALLANQETRKVLTNLGLIQGRELLSFFPEFNLHLHQASHHPETPVLWSRVFSLSGEQTLVAYIEGAPLTLPSELEQALSIWFHQLESALQQVALIQELRHHTLELSTSLLEKETLLKEIHHRVKNNLQILISLLNVHDKSQTLPDISNRIQAMALIHEHLYKSNSLSQVDLGLYLKQLSTTFMQSQDAPGTIEVILPPDPVWLNLEEILPCGLLTNELLTNAWKYAQPQSPKEPLQVSLSDDLGISVSVQDHGPTLKKPKGSASEQGLGLELAQLLAQQLGGTLKISHRVGTLATLHFHPKGAKR